MEKNNLIFLGIVGIIFIIAIVILSLTQADYAIEKDCGTDLDCFEESLKKGEYAKVKYLKEINVPPTSVCYGCDMYFTSKNSEAKTAEFTEDYCKVYLINLKVVSWDKSVEDKIWENAFCYYKRSEEKVVYKSCEEIK